jgi:hypothetical protein
MVGGATVGSGRSAAQRTGGDATGGGRTVAGRQHSASGGLIGGGAAHTAVDVLCEYEKNGTFRLFSCFLSVRAILSFFSVGAVQSVSQLSAAGKHFTGQHLSAWQITACRFSNLQLGRLQLGSAEPARFSAVELVRTSSVHRSRVTDLATDL